MKITATSTNRNLISTTISKISTIHLLLLLLVREVVIIRAGSARLRFARVSRVMRVCVSRGFRACCSARVPRAVSHSNFSKKKSYITMNIIYYYFYYIITI